MIREVVTIGAHDKVFKAIEIMAEHGISSLLVTKGDSLLGIITEKDIVSRVFQARLDPNLTDIINIMSTSLYLVEPTTPISEASKIMTEKKIKKLPVVIGSTKKLVGILSITDLAKLQTNMIRTYNLTEKTHSLNNEITTLLKSEETQFLEFKSTLRWDMQKKCVNPGIERAIMKSICAFLNSTGGDLIIGVSDDRTIIGLEPDYKTLKNQNRDGFENKFTTLISTMIGDPFQRNIESLFPMVNEKEICKVSIKPSKEPAFLNEAGQEVFFVRTGNSSRPFSLSDTVKYVRDRWK